MQILWVLWVFVQQSHALVLRNPDHGSFLVGVLFKVYLFCHTPGVNLDISYVLIDCRFWCAFWALASLDHHHRSRRQHIGFFASDEKISILQVWTDEWEAFPGIELSLILFLPICLFEVIQATLPCLKHFLCLKAAISRCVLKPILPSLSEFDLYIFLDFLILEVNWKDAYLLSNGVEYEGVRLFVWQLFFRAIEDLALYIYLRIVVVIYFDSIYEEQQ